MVSSQSLHVLLILLKLDNVDLLDLEEHLDSEPDRDPDCDLPDLVLRLVFSE